MTNQQDINYMRLALKQAQQASMLGEVPIGAVLVKDNQLIATGHNLSITNNDPTAHAEIICIRQGAQILKNYRLIGCNLYTTIEPCLMCVGALIHARITKVFFGTCEPKTGAIISTYKLEEAPYVNHKLSYSTGILKDECKQIVQEFFVQRRNYF